MGKKKSFIFLVLICFVLVGVLGLYQYSRDNNTSQKMFKDSDSIKYVSKVDSQNFYIYKEGEWQKQFIKGVNIGSAMPGYFPGEFGVKKEDYLRWFKYISDMNANSIRVYTILTPDFYNALYEYNKNATNPLYLFQGVWIDEENIDKYKDAYNEEIYNQFKEDIETTIDVLHGNKSIEEQRGHASGVYNKDLSPYVMAYILGLEWDPEMVLTTNDKNKEKVNYDGEYLYGKDTSPFENFLCEIADGCIGYETKEYKTQRTVSFVNWPTTDYLSHPNEPHENEDKVSVNTEHIKRKDTFKPGLFASYHIYPYYPDFMNYQREYKSFKDSNGQIDTYGAYLKDLKKDHTMPVLVAEFGVPSSRGKAHDSVNMGFNQGNISEKAQGEMEAYMLKDIYEEAYAGALLFAFQDEWFKRTWNTVDFDLPDRRPFWNNPQTNEQHFGLLAFDPGDGESICYIDGETKEWADDTPVYKNNDVELYMKSDEAYVYFMVKSSTFDFQKDKLIIPIDVIENQGNLSFKGVNFNRDADFLINIDGENKSEILIDPYYDSFQYLYGEKLKMVTLDAEYNLKNSGKFGPMNLCLHKKYLLPQDQAVLPFSKYETGILAYGNGNPRNDDYNSLADFCVKGADVEIRIPWQLLNVMDPSTKKVIGDLHVNGISPVDAKGIYVGTTILKDENQLSNIEMKLYDWEQWEKPTFHERLKPSYYILKDEFKKY